ncbi:phytochelatin synthase family protein [Thermodesulfobacteriota bacterium]
MSLKRLKLYLTYFQLKIASVYYALGHRNPGKKHRAVPLSREPSYFRHKAAHPFHRMMPYLIPQFNEASCSVASVAAVLNAVNFLNDKTGVKTPITQAEILESVDAVHWKERVSRKGHRNQRGLTLEMLGIAVDKTLEVYHIAYAMVDVVALHPKMNDFERRKEELKQRLIIFEESQNAFLIAHFNQGIFTGDLHLPHISPVGAYDHEKDRVLIMDVDPDQPEPYWVPFEMFFEGISSDFYGILEKYGYPSGGYVWILLQ